MKKIQNTSAIWDLHIHTCKCPKASSEFKDMNIDDYLNGLIDIFNKYPQLELISFTDHNKINVEVYEKFIKSSCNVEFIVGVEVDTDINLDKSVEKKDFKHIIFYFDISKETFIQNKDLINKINKILDKAPIKIDELLNEFLQLKIPFVISPHAFKQGKRGLDHEFTSEEQTEAIVPLYQDQFFCFWEAQGKSEIARAIKFLNDFNMYDISIISFSDSNNYKKLEEYLKNPPQYFNALPSFKGLQMVGSERDRIVRQPHLVNANANGNLIKKVLFDQNEIYFSDRLNCIIGGRGSGKSILLDAIASHLKDTDIKNDRKNFIKSKEPHVFNFSGNEIMTKDFKFDYFKQSYVHELFESEDYYEKIKKEFNDAFNHIEDIDVETIKQENKERFNALIQDNYIPANVGNISGLVEQFVVLKDDGFKLELSNNNFENKLLDYDYLKDIDRYLRRKVPKKIQDNEMNQIFADFLNNLAAKTYNYNEKVIDKFAVNDHLYQNYENIKNAKSKQRSDKSKIQEHFINEFNEKGHEIKRRVQIVNAYIEMSVDFETHYEKSFKCNGEQTDAFRFKKVLEIQQPLNYLKQKFKDYFFVNELKSDNEFDLIKSINYYCYEKDKKLKDGKLLEDLDNELISFEIYYNSYPKVEYKTGEDYEDVRVLSPGTQTNVLLEYLVTKDTNVPILIDQPEDNVDNLTIYDKLRVWFKKMKLNRQVIVVTHDANIVINADAENVIIANHTKSNSFEYQYGALESEDIIDKASKILDGGKEAVKRRMMKYGE